MGAWWRVDGEGGVMGLNCKLGDLAIVVRSFAGNEGKIVRVVEFSPSHRFMSGDCGPSWRCDCDHPMVGQRGTVSTKPWLLDSQLRPIKPLDELDDVASDNEVTA